MTNKPLQRSPRKARRRRQGEQGLTLIELLVALALVTVLTAFIVGGLSTAVRALNADRRTAIEVANIAAIESLRDFIAAAMPAHDPAQPSLVAFEGHRDDVTFVALSEGRALPGGPQQIRVRRVEDKVIAEVYGSFRDRREGRAPVSVTVLQGIRELRLSYFGALDGQAQAIWRNDWAKTARLPSLVGIGLSFEDRRLDALPIVVALRNQDVR